MTKKNKVVKSHLENSEAMERLRNRTDELELIISSLTIFALLSIPSWLFDTIADIYTHLSISLAIASTVGVRIVAGVSYGLAACFIVHLMARAYWVGLIGLRTAFPDGINWSKTPSLGPMSRKYYRDTLPNIETIIRKTDRFASSLFAVISMLTLSVLWFSVILVGSLVLAGAIGEKFGFTNFAISTASTFLLIIFIGAPILLYLIDAQLAARVPRLSNNRFFSGLAGFFRRVSGLAYPRRLVLPVQLTLQSNTRPFVVSAIIILSIVAIAVIGNTRTIARSTFTLSDEFTYLNVEQVYQGFRSTYYEDMPSSLDPLRGWPRVNSFNQSGSFVTLFLPYMPLRDNLVLDQMCKNTEQAQGRTDCLRNLWSVSIDDVPVPMSSFETAERADIKMRGLVGLVPMLGLKPGLRKIKATWNPSAADDAAPIDDRFSESKLHFTIPIAFAPGYELQVTP